MNIYKEAYNLGKALRNSDEGKNIYDMYKKVQSSLSVKSFKYFHDIGIHLRPYYFFQNSFYILNANKDNKKISDITRGEIKEIISSPHIEIFCNKCQEFGQKLDEVLKIFFGKEISKEFIKYIKSPDIIRALTSLNVAFIRSGLIQKLCQYKENNPNFDKRLGDYIRERLSARGIPFNKIVRKLIKKLKIDNDDISVLYFYELFISAIELAKEIIFETHLGLMLEIDKKDLTKFRILGNNKINFFKCELITPKEEVINHLGTIILLNDDNRDTFLLVTKRTIDKLNPRIIFSGLICPLNIKD